MKTRNFKKYLEKRLSKKEIKEIEKEAEKEFNRLRKNGKTVAIPEPQGFRMKMTLEEFFAYQHTLWGEGPWQNEPDELEFTYKGYQCYLLRNSMGTWCGYVQIVDPDGTLAENYYKEETTIKVHGNVTFGGSTRNDKLDKKGYSWIGFDCCHGGDYVPGRKSLSAYAKIMDDDRPDLKGLFNKIATLDDKIALFHRDDVYRDINFAKKECRKMVNQFIKKEKNESLL